MTTIQDIQVFISVKNLNDDGTPTRDVDIARELHSELESRGLVSFLSVVSLEAMGTAEYKGMIDDALDQADVLVAVGTTPQNLASRWVRYEWDSFFNDIISGIKQEGKVFSLISGLEPAQLPRALRQNQTFKYDQSGIEYLCNFLINALSLKKAVADRDRAEELRRKAEEETNKAIAINEFLTDILRAADPFRGGQGYKTTVLEALAASEASIEKHFADQPEIEALVRHTLGTTYMHLGKYAEARLMIQSALDICRSLYGEDHELTAEKLNEIGRLCHETGDLESAEDAFEGALAIYGRIYQDSQPALAATLNNLGILLRDKGNLDEAEARFKSALEMKRAIFGAVHEEVTPTLNNLGLLLHDKQQLDESETYFKEALASNRVLCEQDHPTIGINLSNLAWVELDKGLYNDAEQLFRESLTIKLKGQGDNHPSTAISVSGLAAAQQGQGLIADALQGYEEAIGVLTRSLPDNHWRIAYTNSLYARCLIESGSVEHGKRLLDESIANLQQELGPEHPKTREAIKARGLPG